MTDKWDDDILVSIRSDNSSDYGDKKQQQKPQNKSNIKANNKFSDGETLDFGASIRQNEKLYVREQLNKYQKKSEGSSDWNQDDTDQLIISVKNLRKGEKRKSYDQKRSDMKNIGEKPNSKKGEIKYPEIDYLVQKPSPKKQTIAEKKSSQDRQQRLNLGNSYDNQQIYVSISMIGQRPSLAKAQKQKQTKIEQKKLKKDQIEEKKQPAIDNPFQSVYLSNAKIEQKKANVVLKIMDRTMYWIYESKQLKITLQALQGLAEQFFKKEIMLPLVSQSQIKSDHISAYMQLYTEFLNYFYPELFKSAFNVVKSSILSGSKMDLGSGFGVTSPKGNQNIGKGLYDQYVSKFFKNSNYSKAQLMRNFMTKKLSMLLVLQKRSKQNHNEENYRYSEQKKSIEQQIAMLQLLVSFERSENECVMNSKQGIDHKIWKQHGKKLRELRRRWIEKIQSEHNDFSFEI